MSLFVDLFTHNFIAKSFVELIRYLFSLPEVKENKLAFLSNHLCQDPFENYFGCQRQKGGTSDNPTVQEYYKNTESLRIVNSFCRVVIVEVKLKVYQRLVPYEVLLIFVHFSYFPVDTTH